MFGSIVVMTAMFPPKTKVTLDPCRVGILQLYKSKVDVKICRKFRKCRWDVQTYIHICISYIHAQKDLIFFIAM